MTLGVLRERPTAALTARDLSEWSGRASAATEGHRPFYGLVAPTPCAWCRCFPCICRIDTTPRMEPCLCTGEIVVADRSDGAAIALAVGVHNASTAHAQWAIAAGWR